MKTCFHHFESFFRDISQFKDERCTTFDSPKRRDWFSDSDSLSLFHVREFLILWQKYMGVVPPGGGSLYSKIFWR